MSSLEREAGADSPLVDGRGDTAGDTATGGTTPTDRVRVAELLGRTPRGAFTVAVRAADGTPAVIRNAPLLDDGTPMPTRYWLIDVGWRKAIDRIEAAGGVRAAEAAVSPAELADAHRRYAAERDRDLDSAWAGPRPSGGVGGTRRGVKCLHAHYAWYLAGGDDPVGRWVDARLRDSGAARPPAQPRQAERL